MGTKRLSTKTINQLAKEIVHAEKITEKMAICRKVSQLWTDLDLSTRSAERILEACLEEAATVSPEPVEEVDTRTVHEMEADYVMGLPEMKEAVGVYVENILAMKAALDAGDLSKLAEYGKDDARYWKEVSRIIRANGISLRSKSGTAVMWRIRAVAEEGQEVKA